MADKNPQQDSKPPTSSSTTSQQTTAKSASSEAGAGLRSLRATSVFKAVNFELYAKPNKGVMAFGLVAITGCVAYVAYMNATAENKADELVYEQYKSDGSTEWTKTKRSKWD